MFGVLELLEQDGGGFPLHGVSVYKPDLLVAMKNVLGDSEAKENFKIHVKSTSSHGHTGGPRAIPVR